MSKEVKRFDPYGYDGLSALMHEDVLGDYVRHEDYGALLAERDALLEVMVEARQVIAVALRANAPDWYATDEEVSQHMTIRKIDAAMQGEQP